MKSVLAAFLSFSLISACADADVPTSGDTDAQSAQPLNDPPTMPELAKGWTQIEPGGETTCSRGSKFFFMVRKGSVNKVVIDFMGGGACWNETTCSFAESIFNEDLEAFEGQEGDVNLPGIYDSTAEANPFKDWYHVFIPYCTGDIHWGNADVDYGDAAGVIHHKGAVNTQSVLDWVKENFSAPESVFVTGCSAGAYGAIGWTPRIIEMFPEAKVMQMGDSGVGVITESFFKESFPRWNAWEILPRWIDSLNLPEDELYDLSLNDVYIRVANHYPEHLFGQFTTAFDQTQVFYYQAMGGGTEEEWTSKMRAGIAQTHQETPNFRSFIAQGNQHCILPYDEFFTKETQGMTVSEWVADMVDEQPVENITCGDPCTK